MKRFSVLVVALFCLGLIITNSSKADSTPDNMAQEIVDTPTIKGAYGDVSLKATFVQDTNVSDKQIVSGTDNKANLRELYYKDGYIYFKYIITKNDEFSVGDVA